MVSCMYFFLSLKGTVNVFWLRSGLFTMQYIICCIYLRSIYANLLHLVFWRYVAWAGVCESVCVAVCVYVWVCVCVSMCGCVRVIFVPRVCRSFFGHPFSDVTIGCAGVQVWRHRALAWEGPHEFETALFPLTFCCWNLITFCNRSTSITEWCTMERIIEL